jgi:hypothetical protein
MALGFGHAPLGMSVIIFAQRQQNPDPAISGAGALQQCTAMELRSVFANDTIQIRQAMESAFNRPVSGLMTPTNVRR